MEFNQLPSRSTTVAVEDPPIVVRLAHELAPRVAEKTYHVPRTLSMSTLLGGMLLFSIVFSIVRMNGGGARTCLMIVAFVVTIAASQMTFVNSPRLASSISGAICYCVLSILSMRMRSIGEVIGYGVCAMFFGTFAGYAIGSLLAGFWLVADYFEKFLQRPEDTSDRRWSE